MKLLAFIGLGLSVYGGFEAFKISHLHFIAEAACPTISVIPACYVVLICYTLMALAWLSVLTNKASIVKRGFWIGFTPAFILAVIGTSGEIFGFASCPKTAIGIPKCFFSLGFVTALGILWAYLSPHTFFTRLSRPQPQR